MIKMKTAVVALGGNAITREFDEGSIYQQFANTRQALIPVVKLVQSGYRVAIIHGNGPQVGNALIRIEASRHLVPPVPLGVIVADLQGGMGYMIQQTLQNKLRLRGIDRNVVTVVTQVLVDENDPSLHEPTKFVGPAYDAGQVDELVDQRGWIVKEDVGRGWRRVVPSPEPLEIIEQETIRALMERNDIVVACGGGGIPVYRDAEGRLEGVDAVIDKDLTSAILARTVFADSLFILTGIEKVALHFATPRQQDIAEMTVAQAEQWLRDGHFPPGSMGPKIRSAINFVKAGGKECIITTSEKLLEAMHGETGTRIVAG